MAEKRETERLVSEGTEDRAVKAEEKMVPAFGKRRRKIRDWPKGRRR